MEKTKDEIIADLYALRGGLSVISGYKDKVRACEDEIEVNKIKLSSNESNATSISGQLSTLRRDLQKIEEEWEERLSLDETLFQMAKRKREEEIQKAESNFIEAKRKRMKAGIAFLICVLLFSIGGLVLLASDIKSNEDVIIMVVQSAQLGIWIFGGLFISRIVSCKKVKKLYNSSKEMGVSYHPSSTDYSYYNKRINSLNGQIKKEERYLNETQQRINASTQWIAENENKIKELALIMAENCQIVKQALNATYDSWLSESDWENVDLLIYYLETGRADTVKEACLW